MNESGIVDDKFSNVFMKIDHKLMKDPKFGDHKLHFNLFVIDKPGI